MADEKPKPPTPVVAIHGVIVTTEDRKSRIDLEFPDGHESFVFTEDQLRPLFAMICSCIDATNSLNEGNPKTWILQTDSWAFDLMLSGQLGVTVKLKDGPSLTFAIPPTEISAAREALQKLEARPTPPKGPLH